MSLKIFEKPILGYNLEPVFYGLNLESQTLIQAYKNGYFPWFMPNEPIAWYNPDPRAILLPNEIRVQKSIKSYIKKYEVRFNYNFENFINFCFKERAKNEPTWLSNEIVQAYSKLYKLGFAHSVEVYFENELVGGLYGEIFGKIFFGESMISTKPNASKVALIALCKVLSSYNFIIDCQVMNPHLNFLGAKNISRSNFLKILKLQNFNSVFGNLK